MNKDKFFVEQTLINLFRNRNPPPAEVKAKTTVPPQDNRLRDVLEYKKALELKINEADVVEKEERALLDSRIADIKTVLFFPSQPRTKVRPNHTLGTRLEGKNAGRAIQARSGKT